MTCMYGSYRVGLGAPTYKCDNCQADSRIVQKIWLIAGATLCAVRQQQEGTPLKASVNGNSCILVLKDDSIEIEFERLQKPLSVKYSSLRCVQAWNNTVLINADVGGKLMSYVIDSRQARKIHGLIMQSAESISGHV